jgi:peptide-methionine (S)-S-oxide reductase
MNIFSKIKIFFAIILLFVISSCAQKRDEPIKKATLNQDDLQGSSVATLAGGCFWCVEAVFERIEGVRDAVSGYTGGKEKNPTYKDVSAGKTTHAEAVQVYFDPAKISYEKILEIFFATHDPTTLNRQGPDIGAQYRSAIYYHNEEQKRQAQKIIESLSQSGKFKNPIVTEVTPFDKFYTAEDYHQDYYEHNPNNPYIIGVTRPKIKKFEKEFKDQLKQLYQ